MTPSDRHEIVVLTSPFSGYVKDMDDFRSYEPRPLDAATVRLPAHVSREHSQLLTEATPPAFPIVRAPHWPTAC